MWTNEEINRLKSQHGHGWSVEESADILERSPLDVRNKLIALGLKPIEETIPAPKKTARKRKHKLTESDKNRVITMRDSGYSLNDIITNTDISLASVQRILKESGRTNPHKTDNWSVKELKNVLELLEPLTIDNGADAMTIGEAIGRLKMMISIAYETERRHGF